MQLDMKVFEWEKSSFIDLKGSQLKEPRPPVLFSRIHPCPSLSTQFFWCSFPDYAIEWKIFTSPWFSGSWLVSSPTFCRSLAYIRADVLRVPPRLDWEYIRTFSTLFHPLVYNFQAFSFHGDLQNRPPVFFLFFLPKFPRSFENGIRYFGAAFSFTSAFFSFFVRIENTFTLF
jgi:hypothetical protein